MSQSTRTSLVPPGVSMAAALCQDDPSSQRTNRSFFRNLRKFATASTTVIAVGAVMMPASASAKASSMAEVEKYYKQHVAQLAAPAGQRVLARTSSCRRQAAAVVCQVRLFAAKGQVCADQYVTVRSRSKRSAKLVVRREKLICTTAPEAAGTPQPPSAPAHGAPPAGVTPRPRAVPSARRFVTDSSDRTTARAAHASGRFLYCTPWVIDRWYNAYWVYHCFWDDGLFVHADVYLYNGNPYYGDYWFSYWVP